jgi:hypothetical protein
MIIVWTTMDLTWIKWATGAVSASARAKASQGRESSRPLHAQKAGLVLPANIPRRPPWQQSRDFITDSANSISPDHPRTLPDQA